MPDRKRAVLDIDTVAKAPAIKRKKRLVPAPSVTDLVTTGGRRHTPFLMKHLEESGALSLSAEELLSHGSVRPFMDQMLAPSRQDRSGALRASSAGGCSRAQTFGYLGVPRWEPKEFDTRQALIFTDGQFRHLKWQAIVLASQDASRADWVNKLIMAQAEVPLAAPCPGYENVELRGHVDGLLYYDRSWVGLEIKGTRDITWVFDAPAKDHVWQVHTYALLLYLASGVALDQFVILYESKITHEVREHLIDIESETTNAVLAELQSTASAIDTGRLPDIIKPCQDRDTTTFFDCAWHHVCHEVSDYPGAVALTPRPA